MNDEFAFSHLCINRAVGAHNEASNSKKMYFFLDIFTEPATSDAQKESESSDKKDQEPEDEKMDTSETVPEKVAETETKTTEVEASEKSTETPIIASDEKLRSDQKASAGKFLM